MFYIFIGTLVVQVIIMTESFALNVRTTLFTPEDLAKQRWNRPEVALLRARMYFQDLIPPQDVSESPDYISALIRYLENCYAAVNKATSNPQTQIILKLAASDVIGGYLKMVALPVTKEAYYSGDISTRDALKLFKYYENIKDQLHSNGRGWSEPLKYIGKPRFRGVRSKPVLPRIKNPCEKLLYVKNFQQNASMPMPHIDWNTHMMFVPLSTQPIVDIKSPLTSSVLMQFHQVASDCEHTVTPGSRNFQENFDDWVNGTVLPHLNDDDFYTAFKGVLSLLESERAYSETKKKHNYFKCLLSNMSKKTMVVLAILILELLCCIPTLLYCVRKKKTKWPPPHQPKSNKKGSNDKTVLNISGETKTITSMMNSSYYKRYMKNKISSDNSTSSGTRHSYSSVTDVITTADEAPLIKKLSSQKSKPSNSQLLRYKYTETDKIDVTQRYAQVSDMTLLPRRSSSKPTSHGTGETFTLATMLPQDKVLKKSKRFRTRNFVESSSPVTYKPYPIFGNEIEAKNVSSTHDERKLEIFDDRLETVMRFSSDKTVISAGNITHSKNNELSINKSKKESQERVDTSKVMLPKQRSKDVMPENRKDELKSEGDKKRKTRTSRIPKKINLPVNHCELCSSRPRRQEPEGWPKSRIPKLGRALDDSALLSSSPKNSKFNVTL